MDKKSLFLILLAVLLLPFTASAEVTFAGMAASIANQVVLVATWIVVIMWVVTGIMFLTAGGEAGKINTAKTALFAAVGGTILVILANSSVIIVKNSFVI